MKRMAIACVLGIGVSGMASAQTATVNELVGISQESALFATLATGEAASALLGLADQSRTPDDLLASTSTIGGVLGGFTQNIADRLNRAAQNDLEALSSADGSDLELPGLE